MVLYECRMCAVLRNNHRIRKLTADGVVTTFVGGLKGFRDGTGQIAQFNCPYGVCADARDNLYVSDSYNRRIRKITPQGMSPHASLSFVLHFHRSTMLRRCNAAVQVW
jgi:hypothetical protein